MILLRAAASFLLLAAAAISAEPPLSPKVIERYRQMLAANPGEGTALDRLWKGYADTGQTAQLLTEYEGQGTFASELILGHFLRKAARDADAVEAFRRAAKLDPASPLPGLALGRLYGEKGRHPEAASALEGAAVLLAPSDPRLPETLVALGTEWLAAGEMERAVVAWERTVALDPRNLDLRRRLAESYTQHRLPERAAAHLEYLVTHAPPSERAQALQRLARLHQSAGRIDEAAHRLEQAIALTTPGNWLRAELQGQLIRLHERAGRTAELEEKWRRQADENPRDVGALLQLVELGERLGHLDLQRAPLEKLVALAPKDVGYRARLARLLVELDQPDRAAELYDALLAEQPANADWVFERARLDLRRDAVPAAQSRIAALLTAKGNDESARAKTLAFYETHRLWEPAEQHLVEDAARGAEEAIVALAKFYFSQRRDSDGERALRRLVLAGDSPEKRAGALVRVAGIVRGQNLLPAAVAALDEAATLTPPDAPRMREIQLALGELHGTLGRAAAARVALELAVSLSRTPMEIEVADQKLFAALSQQTSVSSDAAKPSSLTARLQSALPPSSREMPLTPALAQTLTGLTRAAEEQPSEGAWLRVARWQLWCRQSAAARASGGKALALNAASVPAHELLLKLSTADGNSPAAAFHLGRLAELDPARRVEHQRRAAQLDVQIGRTAQALRTLDGLAHAHPGDLDVLTDLALAQQRAERWEDALTTWRQIHLLSPASRKKEAVGPMLRVSEQLGQPLPAAELLLSEIDACEDAKEQGDLFRDLLAHCVKHTLVPWLRTQWEARRARVGEDWFTEVSYGRILKAAGEKAAAFEVLKNASLASPNATETLPELVREAEDLRRLDAAIELQARLVHMAPQERPDALEKLAALQEKNFVPDDAAQTWEKIVDRFPRDPVAAIHAVEFHLRSGETIRAAAGLRKVRDLEPTNERALFDLARLDLELGESPALAEAEACLEAILRLPVSDKVDAAIRYPGLKPEDAGRLQNRYLTAVRQRRGGQVSAEAMRALRSFWVEAPAAGAAGRDLRLGAVRELARIVRMKDEPAILERWVARWKAVADVNPSEALWALFHADAGEATLDVIAARMARVPGDEQAQQAFIWLALQTRQFDRLSAWMRDPRRTPSERDYVLMALGQHLQSDGERIDPALLGELFPDGSELRLWQTAMLYVQNGRFAEAMPLGRRAMEAATGPSRATMAVELAHWQLCLGEPAEARRLLGAASREPAESFDSAVYAALRETWLLTPEGDRPMLAERTERALDDQAFPIHAAITRALLHALAGDDGAARIELKRLLEMRALAALTVEDSADPSTRLWNFILTAGLRLQSWKLDAAAIAWWEDALADPALVRLQGQQAQETAREARTRLFALRVLRADLAQIDALLAEFRGNAPVEGLMTLGEAVESLGAPGRAVHVFRRVWEQEPGNPQALRNLLSTCRTAGDSETAESVLRTCVAQRLYAFNDTLHRDLLSQWIDLIEARGGADEAFALLRGATETGLPDTRMLARLAQHHERAGRVEEAATTWRRVIAVDAQHTTARLSLAALMEGQGKRALAIAAVQGGGGAEVESKLGQLLFLDGKIDAALTALERVSAPEQAAAAQALARVVAGQGDRKLAREILQGAGTKTTDPLVAMSLQSLLVETLSATEDGRLIPRELNRLRRLAGDDSGRLAVYFSFLQTHARTLGIEEAAEREVREAWADGAGLLPAGMVLFAWQLDRHEPSADALLNRLLARDDAREPWCQALLASLEAAKRTDLLPRARERLARLNPLDDARVLAWVRSLAAAGEKGAAITTLERWSARAWLGDEFGAQAAQLFAELGATSHAEQLFAHITRVDGSARGDGRAALDYARFRLASGDWRGARKGLAAAFQHPKTRDFELLVAWLAAGGRIESAERELADFQLSPSRWIGVRRALFTHFEKSAQPSAAAALLDAHREIVAPGLLERLRALAAKTGTFEPVVAVLEKLASQGADDASTQLALLLADWADTDLVTGHGDTAIRRLQRAQELQPGLFVIAQRLSALHRSRGEVAAAGGALGRFIAAARDPAEKASAERLLAELGAR